MERIARAYLRLFSLVEGPELEPTLAHPQYLAVRAMHQLRPVIAREGIHGKVLDVGAGTGFGYRLLPEGVSYVPTDLPTGRDHMDRAITRRGIAPVKACSVYDISYDDQSFDACLALNLFEHLEAPREALAEIKRVLKPGGQLVIETPFAYPVHGYPVDYNRWTEQGLARLLRDNGFEPTTCLVLGRSVHAIALAINIYLKEGLYLRGYCPSKLRALLFLVLRPLLTVVFATVNVLALSLGLLDRSHTFPCLIGCIAKKQPSTNPG